MLKYIELKSGQGDRGPAWIGRVKSSKSGRTFYFNGLALKRAPGGGLSGNYFDIETGNEYWISGVKKAGSNRHPSGSGKVGVEAAAVAEFLEHIGKTKLSPKEFFIANDICQTDPASFVEIQNRSLDS